MSYNEELIDSFYEIEELNEDQFLRLKETLTRIGISSKKPNERPVLCQTSHILYKRNRYYIVHFKQMFLLDGRAEKTNYTVQDKLRTQKIVELLEKWNLINVIYSPEPVEDEPISLTVISFKEKSKWDLQTKYDIGTKHYD